MSTLTLWANRVFSVAICALSLACAAQPAAAPTAVATIASQLTPTPTVQPPATPVQALPSPTPDPTPAREIRDIVARYQEQIDEATQDSSCYVNREIEATISNLTSRSMYYLRTYMNIPDLNAADVQSVIDYLENQRGRHERLCNQGRGGTVPEIKDVEDVIKYYDEELERRRDKGEACEAAKRAEKLSASFLYENINYVRGVFDAPRLDRDDMVYLVAHFESESGRYAALCD